MRAPTGEAGLPQGVLLISLAWVSTIAVVLIAPVLPTIAETFRTVPGVTLKIPLLATGPSMMVALLAFPSGLLADRLGRRALLLVALPLYGAAGMAPLILSDLNAIIASRLVVGVAEAVIMTCGTALIGEHFRGGRRERWLAVQTGAAPISAIVLLLVGGALGAFGWRTPFLVYGWGFVLFPLVLILLRRPPTEQQEEDIGDTSGGTFDWTRPLLIAVAIVLSMIAFMTTVVQFGFLLTERGVGDARIIGLWSALVTVGNPLGSLAFGLTRGRTVANLTISYLLLAMGLAGMALVPTAPAAIVGAFVANLGAGVMFPTLVTWLMADFPIAQQGRGSGLWTASVFFGQFLGPLVVVALVTLSGSLSDAILIIGAACGVAAVVAAAGWTRGRHADRENLQ